jgi:hypothetical protein
MSWMKSKCKDEMRNLKVFIFLIFVSSSLISCGGLFDTNFMGTDFYTDEGGNKLIADTPRNWEDFVALTARRIESEKKNGMPPGIDTWNEHWVDVIETKKKLRQNPDKYISYIINQRREAGLPDLQ